MNGDVPYIENEQKAHMRVILDNINDQLKKKQEAFHNTGITDKNFIKGIRDCYSNFREADQQIHKLRVKKMGRNRSVAELVEMNTPNIKNQGSLAGALPTIGGGSVTAKSQKKIHVESVKPGSPETKLLSPPNA